MYNNLKTFCTSIITVLDILNQASKNTRHHEIAFAGYPVVVISLLLLLCYTVIPVNSGEFRCCYRLCSCSHPQAFLLLVLLLAFMLSSLLWQPSRFRFCGVPADNESLLLLSSMLLNGVLVLLGIPAVTDAPAVALKLAVTSKNAVLASLLLLAHLASLVSVLLLTLLLHPCYC